MGREKMGWTAGAEGEHPDFVTNLFGKLWEEGELVEGRS